MAEHAALISNFLSIHLVENPHKKILWEEVSNRMATQSQKYGNNFIR